MTASENLTSYQDINALLQQLINSLKEILDLNLIGVYLTGSLTYGGFDPASSDIDFLVVLKQALSQEKREEIKTLHAFIENAYPQWAERIEGSYVTQEMLSSLMPPKVPRPYINEGRFWDPDPYFENEWLINLYALYECGIALIGSDPKEIIPTVGAHLVQEASKRDLLEEWASKLDHPSGLKDSHQQTYLILTLCRILHRAQSPEIVSKKEAAKWVKRTYGNQWNSLIEKAESWHYGQEMNVFDEALAFLAFALEEIKSK